MKLKPFAVTVECPVCNGNWGRKLITEGGIMLSKCPCPSCNEGKITGVILAPTDWDGVSEIECPPKQKVEPGTITGVTLVDNGKTFVKMEPGHCRDCRWWDKCDDSKEKRECGNPLTVTGTRKMFDYLDYGPFFYADFGCIYWEKTNANE